MRRHIIMLEVKHQTYFQDMYVTCEGNMHDVFFLLNVRHELHHWRVRTLGRFKVKRLKQKAFDTPAIVPGTYKYFTS